MPGVTPHLDEFTLLRFTTRDLSGEELGSTARHLAECAECGSVLAQVRRLDGELRELSSKGGFPADEVGGLAVDDPFHSRPANRSPGPKQRSLGPAAVQASESGLVLQEEILAGLRKPGEIAGALSRLTPACVDHRFAVLYALQEAGRRSAENPFGARTLAEETLRWLRRPGREDGAAADLAERAVPKILLRAQARLLLGIACLWMKEFSKARDHFLVAYRSFGRGGADSTSLAIVELCEAQRRALSDEGESALPLARRCRETFESMGLEDSTARARVAEGMAFNAMGLREEAVASYLSASPVFERHGLWSNYVGALNNAATVLIQLGRVDEARRLFARALRRFSQDQHRYWLGYIRIGLAEALFAASQFADAAVSASRAVRVFSDSSLRAHALIAMLLEVECWARCGSAGRARRRLELFWSEVNRDTSLDPVVVQELSDALSGADPNYERLSSLRAQLSDLIQERYRAG